MNDTQLFNFLRPLAMGGGGFQEGEGEQLEVWLLCSRNTVRGHIRSWTFPNNTKLFVKINESVSAFYLFKKMNKKLQTDPETKLKGN